MIEPISEVVYTPESPLRHPAKFLREMFSDLWTSRELSWRLLERNIRAHYRQPLLGYFWVLLPPLAWTVVWVFLRESHMIEFGDVKIPLAVYVLLGTLLWQNFLDALNSSFQQISASENLMTKMNFPRETFLLAGLGEVIFNSVARYLVMIFAIFLFRVDLTPAILLSPIGVIALIGFGFALGLILAPAGMLYNDVKRGLSVFTIIWFFLTPIFWIIPPDKPVPLLVRLNPVTPLLVTTRELMTTGNLTYPTAFILEALIIPVMLLFGWILFRVALPHIIVRLIAR